MHLSLLLQKKKKKKSSGEASADVCKIVSVWDAWNSVEFARVLAGDTGVGSLLHVVGLGQVAEAVWGSRGLPLLVAQLVWGWGSCPQLLCG